MELVLGFDGGGTTCRAAVADLSGRVLGRGSAGAANTASDPDGAVRNILAAAGEAARMAGIDVAAFRSVPAYLGLAGWNVEATGAALAARLPFRDCVIDDDAEIALQGALGDGDGAVAVLGTGSVYLARRGGERRHIGGWGFVVGDLGSGAWLGRLLLQNVLLAHDGIIAHSPLTRETLAVFDGDPAGIVRQAQGGKPMDFARLAPSVFEHAERGDPVAASMIDEGVGHVDASLAALVWPECRRLALMGGVSRFYAPRLDARFRSIAVNPAGDALDGAVQLALRRFHPDAGQSQ